MGTGRSLLWIGQPEQTWKLLIDQPTDIRFSQRFSHLNLSILDSSAAVIAEI